MQEYIITPKGNKYYTAEYVESLREENLNAPAGSVMRNRIPMAGFQEEVLMCEADIVICGGRRGGGKTEVMNLSAAYNIDKVGFSCHGFRKEEKDILNGLWKNAQEMYRGVGEFTETTTTIRFNDGASKIIYAHLQNEKEVDRRYRGIEMCQVIIDELPQISFKTFFTLLSSNRNSLGIRNRFIASCNPVSKKHWVYRLVSWYIDPETNEVIHERSGKIRYFFKYGDNITDIAWGNTREEVYNKAKGYIDEIHDDSLNDMSSKYDLIRSFTFIEGEYSQNKIFRKRDPAYLGNIAQQGGNQSRRDIKGVWGDDDSGEELLTSDQFESMFNTRATIEKDFRCATADVAFKKDFFVLYAFADRHVVDWEAFNQTVSKDCVYLVDKFLKKNNIREENFGYDKNGLGLFLEGFFPKAKGFDNKYPASNPRLWNNQKSECAEKFVEAVKEGKYSFDAQVLDKKVGGMTLRDRLESQRIALQRKPVDNGKFEIIAKSQMKEACGHSPDDLEALFMREMFTGKTRSFKGLGLI